MRPYKLHFQVVLFALAILLPGFGERAVAQPISPAMEQEFIDAKSAVDSAQKAQAEKYSPEPLKQAQDLLVTAENARSFKDAVKFAQASRLARAYAELARAAAELKAEEAKLTATQEDLQKAKAEIERLKKSQ
jgi:hypothetical protein